METPVVEKKESKTGAIIGTIAAVLLCGCPGLTLCGLGAYTATGNMPYTTTVNGYSSQGYLPAWSGYASVCVSIILIAIPVVVGILTLRKKKAPEGAPKETLPPSEPLPPAS
jgi:hypothetical protein